MNSAGKLIDWLLALAVAGVGGEILLCRAYDFLRRESISQAHKGLPSLESYTRKLTRDRLSF